MNDKTQAPQPGEIIVNPPPAEIVPQQNQMILMIERMAGDKNVDVEKLERILALKEREEDREADRQFNVAMRDVQEKVMTVGADQVNTQTSSTYAKLDKINKIIKPIYTRAGFSLVFYEGECDKPDHVRIMCDISHIGGATRTRHTDIPLDNVGAKGSPTKTKTHGTGSSITYGRRYLTCMIFNIAIGKDDDGNGEPPPSIISDEQLADLEAKCEELKVDTRQFAKVCGVADLQYLPVKKLAGAYLRLKEKERQA